MPSILSIFFLALLTIFFFLPTNLACFSEGHLTRVPARRPPLYLIPALDLANLLCHLCAHGPVCSGQCCGGSFDETSRREQQGTVIKLASSMKMLMQVIDPHMASLFCAMSCQFSKVKNVCL